MVLHLKVWESKTLPGLLASQIINKHDAGWSSPVARQAHNLKVVGSNPTPATTLTCSASMAKSLAGMLGAFVVCGVLDAISMIDAMSPDSLMSKPFVLGVRTILSTSLLMASKASGLAWSSFRASARLAT